MPRPRGFTLAELVATLTVLAIVLGLAIPAFTRLLESARVDTAFHAITASFAQARLTAISRQMAVSVCPSGDGRSCRRDLAWEGGWIVYLNQRRQPTPASTQDIVLRRDPNLQGLAIHSTAGRHYMRYQPDGFTATTNLTLTICTREPALALGEIIVNRSGRVRTRRLSGPIPCPYAP